MNTQPSRSRTVSENQPAEHPAVTAMWNRLWHEYQRERFERPNPLEGPKACHASTETWQVWLKHRLGIR